VLKLTAADKIACSVCGGVIRIKGRRPPAAGAAAGTTRRGSFKLQSKWLLVFVAVVCVVIAIFVWI
jgi:hypothetical protein